MKKPPWHPRNDAERELFERWTIERLEEAWNEEVDPHDPMMLVIEPPLVWRFDREAAVRAAARAKDADTIAELATTPELQRIAIAELTAPARRRHRGRPHKVRTSEDELRNDALAFAAERVERIRKIWARHYEGHYYRGTSNPPTAEAIVARLTGWLSERDIIKYKKKRTKTPMVTR